MPCCGRCTGKPLPWGPAHLQVARFLFNSLRKMGMRMHSAAPGTGQPVVVFALPPAAAAAPAAADEEATGEALGQEERERPYTVFEL